MKRVKGYAIIGKSKILDEWTGGQLEIYKTKKEANSWVMEGERVIPCTIHYKVPRSKK